MPAPLLKHPSRLCCPQILRWAPDQIRRGLDVGKTEHRIQEYRARLEEATFETIAINPYAENPAYREGIHLVEWHYSHSRAILGGAGHFEWYLGERLHPFLSYGPQTFAIPHPPPESMQVDRDTYLRWLDAELVPVHHQRVRHPCSKAVWSNYWSVVSGGVRLDARVRMVNTDFVHPLARDHWDLIGRDIPSTSGPSGPVQTSQQPADLSAYYTPHEIHTFGGNSVTIEPHHVDLPGFASSAQWRAWGQHEQGLLMATRDAYAAQSFALAEAERKLKEYEHFSTFVVGLQDEGEAVQDSEDEEEEEEDSDGEEDDDRSASF